MKKSQNSKFKYLYSMIKYSKKCKKFWKKETIRKQHNIKIISKCFKSWKDILETRKGFRNRKHAKIKWCFKKNLKIKNCL